MSLQIKGCPPSVMALFKLLKRAMTKGPVLAMPDYSKPFVIEVDACGQVIGAVLTQEGKSIINLSKAIGKKNVGLSTYEKVPCDLDGCVKMEALP